ncbi:MAG: CotH kinase family protein [Crocinitomicaceae bacterium]
MIKLFNNKFFLFACALILGAGAFLYWKFKRVPEFNLEALRIELDDASYERLSTLRDEALEKGHLERSEDDYVSSTITYRSQKMDAEMRLKGDWLDHLATNKWSFRIKLNDPMSDGLKEFSIQNPACRDYLNGYLFYELMQEEGIMTNEFRYIQVYVNGYRWGVYCLEEHLTDRMILNNKSPNGVLLKFDDANFFRAEMNEESSIGLIKEAEFKVYGDAVKNELYNDAVYKAKSIIQDYKLQTDSVYSQFDAKKMGTYYALCDIAIAYHAMGWINMRFYYNFETKLMEPVAYDPYPLMDWGQPYLGHNLDSSRIKDRYDPIRIVYKALENENIYKEYNQALMRFSSPEYIHNFMAKRQQKLEFYETEIQKEYKNYEFDFQYLKDNGKAIRAYLVN